jgi:Tol biopolymer transport system component
MINPLDHLKDALADRYTIETEIGAGGMATVYLAHDVRHDRKVALKVLRPEVAAVLGAERFLQEIKTTANLQHPHILPLFDSGQEGPFLYYVMPFVAGETLREKLNRETQLGIDEAVKIATDVADALDYAHRQNVIHRDIKPENILLQDGRPVVTDFGIALAISHAGGSRLTETGLSLGTPDYMSPEQATGDRELDARSDVYSLGALTYEMLTGEPPHVGRTVQAIVAKILTEAPSPITHTRSLVPSNVDAAVQVALAKAPADRFTTAKRFAEALADPTFVLPTAAAVQHTTWRGQLARFGWPLAAAVFALLSLWLAFRPQSQHHEQVVRAALTLGSGQALSRNQRGVGIAPDASFFVYPGSADADEILWLRPLNQLEAHPIPGSEGGWSPRVSPDGRRVAFSVWDGLKWTLKVASLNDGTVRSLTDTLGADVADWGPGDQLYFQGKDPRGLWRISANGGQPEQVTAADRTMRERTHARPDVLPNGRGVLFNTAGRAHGLAVLDLGTGEVKRLGVDGDFPQYVAAGYVIYRTSSGGESLIHAIPFDAERLEVTGESRQLPFLPRVGSFGSLDIDVSLDGTLVYVSTDRGRTDLVWVARDGSERLMDPDWNGVMAYPRISPDGRSVVGETRASDGRRVIAVKDLSGGPLRPITFDVADPRRPTWHPDGSRVTYYSSRQQLIGTLDGRPPVPVAEGLVSEGAIWSPDGQWLVIQVGGSGVVSNLYVKNMDPDSAPRPLIASDAADVAPAISPNSRYIAYVANYEGQGDVVVRPFPNVDDGRIQVSFNGGYSPVWSRDGRELFYRDGSGRMLDAHVSTTGAFRVDSVETLFSGATYEFSTFRRRYDVDPDGERFLMVRRSGDELILVDNWFEELREVMGER